MCCECEDVDAVLNIDLIRSSKLLYISITSTLISLRSPWPKATSKDARRSDHLFVRILHEGVS